jgi:hypothetical protein
MLTSNAVEADLEKAKAFKLGNMDLERKDCHKLTGESLRKRFKEYLDEFTEKELDERFLGFDEDTQLNVYQDLLSFVEESLVPKTTQEPNVHFGHTQTALRFFRNHFQKSSKDVLFVSIGLGPLKQNENWLIESSHAETDPEKLSAY